MTVDCSRTVLRVVLTDKTHQEDDDVKQDEEDLDGQYVHWTAIFAVSSQLR